jgi:hypothetical protein
LHVLDGLVVHRHQAGARAASMAMLHTVMRPSMLSARMALPANSMV